MSYTYNHQIDKQSGTKVASMFAPKNNQDYKILGAEDLAWDVTLHDDDSTLISTTDDLLDYIVEHGGSGGSSNTGIRYQIECSVTTCTAGEVFDGSIVITVNKIVDGVCTIHAMTWDQMSEDKIVADTSIIPSAATESVIKFDSTQQCLKGTAVKGSYQLKLKIDSTVIATYTLTVVSNANNNATVYAYIHSDTLPDKPKQGSVVYNFTNNTVNFGTSGWSGNSEGLTSPVWYSIGTVYSDTPNYFTWTTPNLLLSEKDFVDTNSYLYTSISVYKAVTKKTIDVETGKAIDNPSFVTPSAPNLSSIEEPYSFDDKEFTSEAIKILNGAGWYTSLEDAANVYKNSVTYEKLTDLYTTYVSYNNYNVTYDSNKKEVDGTYAETGWTDPIEFINVDEILETAQTNSEEITSTAISDAREDIDKSIENLDDRVEIVENATKDLTTIDAVVAKFNKIYTWQEVDEETAKKLGVDYIVNDVYSYEDLKNSEKYSTSEYMDACIYLTANGKYYWRTASSAEIINKLDAVETAVDEQGNRITEVKTTVNLMTPDYIRLQASKANLSNATWTAVEYDNSTMIVGTNLHDAGTALPTENFIYGDYYFITCYKPVYDEDGNALLDKDGNQVYQDGKTYTLSDGTTVTYPESTYKLYYRCDYPISTGFLNVLADNVNLGVVSEDGKQSSTINLTVGSAEIVADTIKLDGDVIASAITTKDLNINNTTYLKGTGESLFGQGTAGASGFITNGSGYLAGGLIDWNTSNNTCTLNVKGTLTATAGYIGYVSDSQKGFEIVTIANTLPAMYAKYVNSKGDQDELYISPQYIASKTVTKGADPSTASSTTSNWYLDRDGSGLVAKGNIKWDTNGKVTLGDDVTISWGQVDGRPTDTGDLTNNAGYQTSSLVENTITSKGYVTSDTVTLITKDTVTTQYVNALNITAAKVSADNVTAGTLNTISLNAGDGTCTIDGTTGKLIAKNAEISGEIIATSGKIGALDIESDDITNRNASVPNTASVILVNSLAGTYAGIGGNLNSVGTASTVARFENKKTTTTDHYSICIDGGMISQINPSTVIVTGDCTISRDVCVVIAINSCTITLPQMMPWDNGHVIRILARANDVYVKVNAYNYISDTSTTYLCAVNRDGGNELGIYYSRGMQNGNSDFYLWSRLMAGTVNSTQFKGMWLLN